jgi:iron complex outermembrane recepter protein
MTQDGHWRTELWGKNVTNTYYWNTADYEFDPAVRYTGMPATYGITLSYRY